MQKHQKWEFRRIRSSQPSPDYHIRTPEWEMYGEQGWELVSTEMDREVNSVWGFFKRPISDEEYERRLDREIAKSKKDNEEYENLKKNDPEEFERRLDREYKKIKKDWNEDENKTD